MASYHQLEAPSSPSSKVYLTSLKNIAVGSPKKDKLLVNCPTPTVFERLWRSKKASVAVLDDQVVEPQDFQRSVMADLQDDEREVHVFRKEESGLVIRTRKRKAMIHVVKGQYHDALQCFNECLVIQQKLFGSIHPEVGTTLNEMGVVLCKMGDDYRYMALVSLEESLRIRQECHGPGSKECAETLKNLWVLLHQSRN